MKQNSKHHALWIEDGWRRQTGGKSLACPALYRQQRRPCTVVYAPCPNNPEKLAELLGYPPHSADFGIDLKTAF
jgi:hypothetical protein